jgi:4-methylaminobutanoate oxidase (formaldehyde-forming)
MLHLRRVSRSLRLGRAEVGVRCLSAKPLPEEVDVVVVGGGIIGSSVAYHLAKLGGKNQRVLLVERDQVTSGTTWHAAGLMVTFGSLSETSTEMRKYTKELYSHVLEEETGQSTGFKPCGFIELATNEDRLEEYRRISTFNRYCGVDVQEITPEEVKAKFPLIHTDDVLAGFYVPTDGRVNPVDATMAFVAGARKYGATIAEHSPVKRLLTTPTARPGGRRAMGVEMQDGTVVRAKTVVNCAGMWARQFSEEAGVVCPNQAAEHYYLVTDAMSDVDADWPVVEDPSSYTYIRPEGGGLMIGLFEGKAASWNVESIPSDFSFGEITPDWERMEPYLEAAMSRVPRSLEVGAKNFFCGPESFTPDLGPMLGETPEVDNFFLAAGMNSIGILTGGGAGKLVAEWVLNGKPGMDVTGVSPARFQDYQMTPQYRHERVQEMLGKVYKCHYPNDSPASGRGARQSPIFNKLKDKGAFFRDVSGFESADWFTLDGSAPGEDSNPLTWGRPAWFANWAEEHAACREGVVLLDMSFMSKFHVRGAGAGALLNRLSTANVDGDSERVTYTQWLNEDGHMEADLTIAKLGEDDFMVVVTDSMHRWARAWMDRHVCEQAPAVSIADVTGGVAQINVQGPLSRKLLQSVTDADLSDNAFAFRDAKHISIGFAKPLCLRITYLGELGYELFVPAEQAEHVYEVLNAAGETGDATDGVKLRHAGLKALASLRLEKGYRDFGHDVDNTDHILETGLAFTLDMDKEGGFIGKEAVHARKLELTADNKTPGKGPMKLTKRLCNVLCEDPNVLFTHGEVLFRDGDMVGYVRAGSYGHTLGGAVGIAQVEAGGGVSAAFLREGLWEVEVAGSRYPVRCSLAPLYDPKNTRIKM